MFEDNDMWNVDWSKLIAPFLTLSALLAIWAYLARLSKERQAGRRLFEEPANKLIYEELEKTLSRLRGQKITETWLSSLSIPIEHRLVTPQFLRSQEIQDWLLEDQVCTDLKDLAIARIIEVVERDGRIKERLAQAYILISRKHKAFAIEAVNGVVAILVAGYKASLHGAIPLAGFIQANFTENREELERVGREISDIGERMNGFGANYVVVAAHTDQAMKQLDRVLKRRGFRADRIPEEIRVLARQITEGDFRYADQKTRTKILYWAARIHTADVEQLSSAKDYLDQLHELDPEYDIRIISAFIMEKEGHVDAALNLLRDIDDSDGHSALWAVLRRTRGTAAAMLWFDQQPGHEDSGFLTGIGWSNLAVSLVEMEMWEKACDALAGAQGHLDEWPDLAYVEGVFNAAMLLPPEMRPLALQLQIFHSQIHTVKRPDTPQRRARAHSCFSLADKLMTALGEDERAEISRVWLLWLRLTDEDEEIKKSARGEVQVTMKDPARAVDFLPIALAFGIEFDKDPLQRYLIQRAQLGGLVGQEIVAEVLLAETTMTSREFADFLERQQSRLAKQIPIATLAGKRIESLLADGQIARSKHVLEVHKNAFVEYDYDRLRAMILKSEGGDPRTTLEEIYSRTGLLFDLHNLVRAIEQARDWTALRPLLEKLFQLERTTANAYRLVTCMDRDPRSGSASIATFFQESPDVADWSDDLRSAKAWALFSMGQSKESRLINDQLLNTRNNPADLQLDMNLALQSGDWERFPAIVDREWDKRDAYDPNLLLRLASLAAEADTTASRAFELAKLAANKAPNDPRVLMNSYSLSIQLGRDSDADPTWMTRAAELSSDSGPVHRVDMRTLVQEMMPAQREREMLIERSLLRGEVPLPMAAAFLQMPLSRILLDLPRRNAEQADGRLRVIIPIVSGSRPFVRLQASLVVGLDVTSLMVLGFLGLLQDILTAFNNIILAPETMIGLLDERRRVRFHQPSRINDAEEILELIEKGQLKPGGVSPQPPSWLVEEVGRDFAEILEAARINNGRVVRPRPIYQLRTHLEKEADLKGYDGLILSTTDLGRLLVEKGKLGRDIYEQAKKYLVAHDKGQEVDTLTAASISDAPLYLDGLAVTYLQHAGLLQLTSRSGIDLRVHPSMREEQSALVIANKEGERLNEKIDDIRSALREALDNGKAILLPRQGVQDRMVGTLSGFLEDSGKCDIICIDDRFLNRHSVLTDNKGRNVPITCTLDLISYLEAQGLISTAKKQATLHRLREAGFALVPVDPDELERMLRAALFDSDNQLIETPELRVIRQLLMRIRSLDMIQHPQEAPFLHRLRLACILTIRRLWQDNDMPVDRAVCLTNWVWRNVAPSPLDWERTVHSGEDGALLLDAYVKHLTPIFSPMGRLKLSRYKAFLQWIEDAVLEPLVPANNSLIDNLAKQLRIEIVNLVERTSDGTRQDSDR